ncbi:baeRF11 domain-containing protein [Dermatobacter hominis]|uniref:baeRF11 domain-containing protein n=1 Tax=Dermatobacter hominis TaxID=2884263 RepID=UPI001D128079|nr:hypothetical protein [Dermatobacter hominis]UDY37380.1 hypothetical protein LH044_07525 [Dermatobacter hominis]
MHVHQPTPGEIEQLLSDRGDARATIYLATSPVTDRTDAERIAYKDAVARAVAALHEAGVDKRRVAGFEELLGELDEDPLYWDHQARTLAVFTDGEVLRSYHLANELTPVVKVTDRYFVKPLLRSVTFPQACFVLALAEGSVRLLELGPDYGPIEVEVPDLPASAAAATHHHKITDHVQKGSLSGDDGSKIRLRQYARAVDAAIRPLVRGHELPLLLAAAEPTASAFRAVNTSPELEDIGLEGSPEKIDDLQIAREAREVLAKVYEEDLQQLADLFSLRDGQDRVQTDVSDLARSATYGQIDTLVVDIDQIVWGRVDDDGAVTFADEGDEGAADIIDEVVRRVLASDGTVLAVRAEDVYRGGAAAAVLRYA